MFNISLMYDKFQQHVTVNKTVSSDSAPDYSGYDVMLLDGRHCYLRDTVEDPIGLIIETGGLAIYCEGYDVLVTDLGRMHILKFLAAVFKTAHVNVFGYKHIKFHSRGCGQMTRIDLHRDASAQRFFQRLLLYISG